MQVYRERLSMCICVSFPFGSEGGMYHLIVLIPDHSISFYLSQEIFAALFTLKRLSIKVIWTNTLELK